MAEAAAQGLTLRLARSPVGLEAKIRDIPDFPQPGIVFKDITPLLGDRLSFREAIERLAGHFRQTAIDKIVAIEARGFIVGGALAYELGTAFAPVRKPGKLPAETVDIEYTLEYGSNVLSIHRDALAPGERILVVDDLLATGGTAGGAIQLVEQLGGRVVGVAVLVELGFLNGRQRLNGYDVVSLIQYS